MMMMMMMMMMFVGLRPMTIGSWLSYEMWDIRSVNILYVDNKLYFGRFLYENYKKKKYPVFHLIYDWCFIPYKGMLHITSCIQNKK
jgi:hypothetical protein